MKPRPAILAATIALATLVGFACRSSVDIPNGAATSGTPAISPTPTISAVPTFGDGHSGTFTLSSGIAVINICHAVKTASGASALVTSTSGFAAGDALLFWQVRDDLQAAQDTSPLTNLGNAGNYEIARLAAISSSGVLSTSDLTHSYSSTGTMRAQVCRVPEYSSAAINGGSVTGLAWTGSNGVVAFLVQSVLNVDATVEASGLGFPGGSVAAPVHGASTTADNTSSSDGGGKGLGIDSAAPPTTFGRGNWSNGGGGGDGRNCSGAGGANAGTGGDGGILAGESATSGGIGGRSLSLVDDRLLPGGGGGAGQNEFGGSSNGGAGGGVILIRAGSITLAGALNANGSAASDASAPTANGDSAGGGGAGGTVRLVYSAMTQTGAINVDGGAGGNAARFSAGNTTRGGGGGGGGGFVRVTGSAPGACTTAGGTLGLMVTTSPSPATVATPVGNVSTPGQSGSCLAL